MSFTVNAFNGPHVVLRPFGRLPSTILGEQGCSHWTNTSHYISTNGQMVGQGQ